MRTEMIYVTSSEICTAVKKCGTGCMITSALLYVKVLPRNFPHLTITYDIMLFKSSGFLIPQRNYLVNMEQNKRLTCPRVHAIMVQD